MSDATPEKPTLHELVEQLRARNEQLERALESRILIEQAKGVLAERYGMSCEDAFGLLRRAARFNRLRIHELAQRVVDQKPTPPEIELERTRLGSTDGERRLRDHDPGRVRPAHELRVRRE